MRTCTEGLTGCELIEYTKEESEEYFWALKRNVFFTFHGGQCVLPGNVDSIEFLQDQSWPCLIFPQRYICLKRDVDWDGEPAKPEGWPALYGHQDDPSWYRDDITPFLDILSAWARRGFNAGRCKAWGMSSRRLYCRT